MSIELPVIFSLIFLLTMSYNRFITIKQTYSSWELQKGRDISMLVSTKGRYALRVMIDLAEQKSDEYIPLKAIAERQKNIWKASSSFSSGESFSPVFAAKAAATG